MRAKPIIEVNDLSKCYRLGQIGMTSLRDDIERLWRRFRHGGDRKEDARTFWALRDVSFSVQQGEVLGVIGKNGAGKSTLLKLLSRITEPTSGQAILRGRLASLLEVGTGFHRDLTGRENIFLNGATLGMTRAEIRRKFDEIVDFSGVEKFLDTPVKRYSSGMIVRLGFAVAAHLEPEILIIDEVLAVGDAEFQKRCLGKMHSVSQDAGRTVIFVSHNMNAIEHICGRCLMLKDGRIDQISKDVSSVIKSYLDLNKDSTGVNLWRNQGGFFDNDYFLPLEMKAVHAESGESPVVFTPSESVMVKISGLVRTPKHNLQVGFGLYTADNLLLFWSTITDGPEESWPTLDTGRCEFTAVIPPGLLNQGSYRVELFLGLHHEKWISEPGRDAPSMTFNIAGKLSDSPHWVEKRPGLLAPHLTWQCALDQ
jgi:lipopolysaccharide transport system ATP-binding protein